MVQIVKKTPAVLLAGLIAVAAAFAIGSFTAQSAYAAELGEGVLYVGGYDIVVEGGTVTGDDGQGTAVLTYDDDGNPVLTLNNYKCENCTGGDSKTYNAVINYRGTTPFTIQMIGVNAVKSASGNYVHNGIFSKGPLVITGDGSLSASGVMKGDYRNCGIVCSKDIWIQSGIVTAIGGDTQESSGSSYGIRSDNIIKITGGTVNASGGNAGGDSYGIAGFNGVEITGGNVKAIAGSAGNNFSYGIWGGATTTIDIGSGVTRVESAGANSALIGIIKNAIPGTGWDSTDGTGDGTLIPDNQSGAYLYYKKVVFEPTLDVRIKGNTSNVKYNGKEQFATGFTAEYKVSDGGWTAKAPDGVSVNLKEGVVAEAKGTNVNTYEMGLTADSFDINPGNYKPGEVTVTDGSLTIGRAPLTIKAKDKTLTYNGQIQGGRDTPFDDPAQIDEKVAVSGLQGSDTLTSIFIDGQGTEIGEYPITLFGAAVGNATENYAITYVDGTLTITPIPLKVTINGSSAKKVYNGKQQTYTGTVTVKSSDPAFDASKFSYTGSTVVKGTKAGVYTTRLATEGCVYNDPYYELNVSIGEPVKLTIEKAPLTIKAKDQTFTYNGKTQGEGDTVYADAAQIAEKVTASGLQGSDKLTSIVIDGQGTEIGEYPITLSGAVVGNATENYAITYVNGTLTIEEPTPVTYTVTFVDGQGKTLKTEKVESGKAATAPATPKRSGYTFTGWDKDFSKVTRDLTVTAKWKKNAAKVSGTLLSKITAKGKSSLVLTWSKVKGADGYVVFFSKCGTNISPKKVKTIKGNKTFKWTKKGLKAKKGYKAFVKAYTIKNGKKTYVRTGPMVHAYTSGGTSKYTNAKSVTVKKKSVSLKAGKTYKIKANVVKLQKGKKLVPTSHAPKLRYVSSNKKIATVSKSGKITAKSKGNCKVYVIAVNGASKAVKVTVR